MDLIMEKLEAIEAKLDRALFKAVIDLAELRRLTGCRSNTAQFRWNAQHGIKAYVRGKYRRSEIENKIAHLRLFSPKPLPVKKPAKAPRPTALPA